MISSNCSLKAELSFLRDKPALGRALECPFTFIKCSTKSVILFVPNPED